MWFLAHESCIKCVIIVTAGVLKFTVVVDDDTTLHDEHTDKVAFSPTVLIKCSICSCSHSLTRTPLEWLEKNDPRQLEIFYHHFVASMRYRHAALASLSAIWLVLLVSKIKQSIVAKRVRNVDKRVAFLFAGCSQHLSVFSQFRC